MVKHKILGFNTQYPAKSQNILTFSVKSYQKSAVEHSIEKSISINFVNLSTLAVGSVFK